MMKKIMLSVLFVGVCNAGDRVIQQLPQAPVLLIMAANVVNNGMAVPLQQPKRSVKPLQHRLPKHQNNYSKHNHKKHAIHQPRK